jgi:Cu/Ag efflux protein CusF
MRLFHPAVLFASLTLSFAGWADEAPAKKPKASYHAKETQTLRATVKDIDLATRHVTLQTADGETHSFVVGDQARNLPQVKVGDEVIVQYQAAIGIDVTETDPTKPLPPPTEAMATDRADLGKKPEGVVARSVTLNGTVKAIDLKKQTAIIKGSGGNTVEVHLEHPERWTKVKVGDTVTARYSEALAIAVQPAGPKMPAPPAAPAKGPSK